MTWNRQAIQSKVIEVFKQHKQTDADVSEASQIVADLGIDSLGIMEVLGDVEDTFRLTIPDEALRNIETIADVIGAIHTRLESDGRLEA